MTTIKESRSIDWVNTAVLTLSPLVVLIAIPYRIWMHGFSWWDVGLWALLHVLTSVSVTGGYHRYFSHRAYECSTAVKIFYLVFGASAVQNSVLNWASDHRDHHRFTDTPKDPYNIMRGGWYAHMGWIFYKDSRAESERFSNIPDLQKDKFVLWQHRWYLPLVILVTFMLPTALGWAIGRPLEGLLWGGFARMVGVHHTTFFINSLAHLFGNKPYDLAGTARDSWWLAPLTFGEGYHNFHHKFQADYRNGIRWWQFDSTKWFINILSWMGQVDRLRRAPESLILKARLEVDKRNAAIALESSPVAELVSGRIQPYLNGGARRLEEAHRRYLVAKAEYRHRYDEWSAEMRRQWDEKLKRRREEYLKASEQWRQTLRALDHLSRPSASSLMSLAAVVDLLKHTPR